MSAFLYYVVILPLSHLPYWCLYRLSDVLFVLFFHLSGYRKKVVMSNLKRSFPDKSPREIHEISRKFYRHFCDLIVESIKNFSISLEECQKRMKTTNPELVAKYARQGKHVIVAAGHNNNWELWGIVSAMHFEHELIAIYKPLSNAFFDKKMRQTRQKYGMRMEPMSAANGILAEPGAKPKALVLAIDQSPGNPQKAYWTRFLNQETGVLFGTELYAARYEIPVVYGHLKKVKRGYYEVTYEVFTEDGSKHPYGEITRGMTAVLEKDIIAEPEFWLWSHKRWKHPMPANRTLDESQPPA